MVEPVVAFAVGLIGVSLGAWLARRNEKRAATERLFAEAMDDVVGGIADEASDIDGAQARYASGMARVAVHGSSNVVGAMARWQREATTETVQGKQLLMAAITAARDELGQDKVDNEAIALLLFGSAAHQLDAHGIESRA